jgi:dTMP kinase
MVYKGLFITFEGIEGSGKTTLIPFARDYLVDQGVNLIMTREPGGTEIAELIREIILRHSQEKMNEDTELLLYFASRAQHLAQKIKPALEAGQTVLCDRFTDSSFAYQGGGRGLDESRIAVLENFVHRGFQPDITILFDVDPKIGLKRIQNRKDLDRFDVEKQEFFERVRAVYLKRAKQYSDRYRIIDANKDLESVKRDLKNLLDQIGIRS